MSLSERKIANFNAGSCIPSNSTAHKQTEIETKNNQKPKSEIADQITYQLKL